MLNRNDDGTPLALGILLISFALVAQPALAQDNSPRVRFFTDSNSDRVPALTAFPSYPRIARRDRIEGEATVCFKIRSDGKITKARVESSTHRIFAKPSLRAIKKSAFEPLGPGQVQGNKRTCRTYRFRLDPIPTEAADTSD